MKITKGGGAPGAHKARFPAWLSYDTVKIFDLVVPMGIYNRYKLAF